MVTAGGIAWTFDPPNAVLVGRSADNHVVINNSVVSSHHLRIEFTGVGWRAIDTGSSNGTFASSQPVTSVDITGALELELGGDERGAMVALSLLLPTVVDNTYGSFGEDGFDHGPMPRSHTRRTEFFAAPPAGSTTLVGRGELRPDGRRNGIVLTDLACSRAHAELRPSQSGLTLIDNRSSNGTFIDGERISVHELREGERVSMGAHVLRFQGGQLLLDELSSDVTFAVDQLSVRGRDAKMKRDKVLLDAVSFTLPPSSFMAVIGPSGCGKSTLIKAISRTVPSAAGSVLFDGNDLFARFDEFRRNIGYVPQDDIVHTALTPQLALSYAAELRFPSDASAKERADRVEAVITEMGLEPHRHTVVAKLSGGQRKRVSIALELLTRPSVLLLDEPTSGLDPGYEKSVMEVLRALADQGRTIIVVTHAMQSLELCDRVLALAPGGRTAFYGRPSELKSYFHTEDFAEVFRQLEASDEDWAAEYARSPLHALYVGAVRRDAPVPLLVRAKSTRPPRSRFAQLWTLVRRYLTVIAADRRNLAVLALQAPIIGAMLALLSRRGFRLNEHLPNTRSMLAVLSLVLAGTYLGASNAVREIVKELPILQRERAVGLSISAYVLAKALVLGAVTLVQAGVLVLLATAFADGPTTSVVVPGPKVELILVIGLTGLAAMGLGLLVSATVSNADKATTTLPVILLAMYLLSGGPSDPSNTPVLRELSLVNSAKWGLSAAASSVDLKKLNRCVKDRQPDAVQYESRRMSDGTPLSPKEIPDRREWDDKCKQVWDPEPRVWWGNVLALGTILLTSLAGAAIRLEGNERRRQRA